MNKQQITDENLAFQLADSYINFKYETTCKNRDKLLNMLSEFRKRLGHKFNFDNFEEEQRNISLIKLIFLPNSSDKEILEVLKDIQMLETLLEYHERGLDATLESFFIERVDSEEVQIED